MEERKISFHGYNPRMSGEEFWEVLDDRIILKKRKRTLFGKLKEEETIIRYQDISQIDVNLVLFSFSCGSQKREICVDYHKEEEKLVIIAHVCACAQNAEIHFPPAWYTQKDRLPIIEYICLRARNAERFLPPELKKRVNKNTERLNLLQSGKWDFPAEKFYNACKNQAKLTSVDNEYSLIKAKRIAEQYMEKELIDPSFYEPYFTAEKLTYYFEKGKALSEKTAQRNAQKKEGEKHLVITGKPTKEEKTFLDRAAAMSSLSGVEKRKTMLSNLVSDYDVKINALKEGEEALNILGVAFLEQQKKETSWAIMGGIADGIAGPAAGLAVAAETMANNRKIQEHNAAMRQAAMDIMSGAPQLSGDRYDLEIEQEKILRQIKKTDDKIALSHPDATTIWENIQIKDVTIRKTSSKVLAVTMTISLKESLVLEVPDNVRMVIDGTIKGRISLENVYVGEVLFPLPIYGIPTKAGQEIMLDGLCINSTKTPGDYTLKLNENQNIWVMEA